MKRKKSRLLPAIILFLLCFFAITVSGQDASISSTQINCTISKTLVPPFYISSVSNGKDAKTIDEFDGLPKVRGSDEEVTTENFYTDIKNKNVNKKLIARGTIVRLIGENEEALEKQADYIEKSNGGTVKPGYVNVEVLDTKDLYVGFKPEKLQAKYVKQRSNTMPADTGWVYTKSLIKADGKYVFVVNEDSTLIITNKLPAGSAITPLTEGPYYVIKVCNEKTFYLFSTLGLKQNRILPVNTCKDLSLTPIEKSNFSELINLKNVMKKELSLNISLDQFQVNDWGRISLPLQNETKTTAQNETAWGPNNIFVTYANDDPMFEISEEEDFFIENQQPDIEYADIAFNGNHNFIRAANDKNAMTETSNTVISDNEDITDQTSQPSPIIADPKAPHLVKYYSDNWGEIGTVCGIIKIAQEWKTICQKDHCSTSPLKLSEAECAEMCTMQIGDISFITPVKETMVRTGRKSFSWTNADPLGHKTHHEGMSLDIRPFRNDALHLGQVWGHKGKKSAVIYDPTYNHDLNKAFIKFLNDKKVENIYFNDPNIPGRSYASGHSDHIHFKIGEKAQETLGCKAPKDFNLQAWVNE